MIRTLTLSTIILSATLATFTQIADSGPKVIHAPNFVLSAEDKAAGIGGKMKVAVSIDETGKVKGSSAYVGPEWPCSGDLDKRVRAIIRSAEEFVRQYRFEPATKNDKPVASVIGIQIDLDVGKPEDSNVVAGGNLARTIAGGVINGKAKLLAKPTYPPEARAAGAQGTVNVQVLIDETGKIVSAQAIDGPPLLHFSARDAACRSKYAPTTLGGAPVKVSGTITYNYVYR